MTKEKKISFGNGQAREYALSVEFAYEQNLERMKYLEENDKTDTDSYNYLKEITKRQKEFIDAADKVH